MPPDVPVVAVDDSGTLQVRRRAENFPVALRLLPAAVRAHLVAVYDVARVIDDTGDEAPGDRAAQLDALEADVWRVWSGTPPVLDVFAALAPTVRACALTPEPFVALIEANRLDQRRCRYPTWDDLRGYCALSADPIGRIVLEVFGVSTPTRIALSDDVCTALQVLEHCQDVAEDRRRGRCYLPQEDLARFGVDELDLDERTTSADVRALVAFEVERAERLLRSGGPLVRDLGGWARVAVAGYVAGGLATVDALRRADCDVLASTPRPRRRDVVRHAPAVWAGVA